MTQLIGVYGAGGAGRGILPILRRQFPDASVVFIDDYISVVTINGHPVVAWQTFLSMTGQKFVSITIAHPITRKKIAQQCDKANIPLIEARADNVVIMDNVQVGDGACLSPFTTITSNIQIGRCFHSNLYSYVEHDSRIGDFVTFAPGVKCNGNVHVHDHVYIGSGAILRQGTPEKPLIIGRGAFIGMGAVVIKDVPPGTTVAGNPATPLVKKD